VRARVHHPPSCILTHTCIPAASSALHDAAGTPDSPPATGPGAGGAPCRCRAAGTLAAWAMQPSWCTSPPACVAHGRHG